MKIYGYELLYRRSQNNFFEGLNDNQATAEVINNAYFAMHFDKLTDGTRAFINFAGDLLEREVPLLLPKENLVVEVLEHVEPTDVLVAACRKLVLHGYTLALDDYTHREEKLPLLELVSIVKLELASLQKRQQQNFFQHYRGRKRFVAEKIDTQDSYALAHKLGFDLFQGYFFCKPMVIMGREIGRLNANLIKIITELSREQPDFQVLASLIKRDISWVYKLLRLANSAAFGGVQRIESIEQALVRLGLAEFKKWVYLFMLMDAQTAQNREIIKI